VSAIGWSRSETKFCADEEFGESEHYWGC